MSRISPAVFALALFGSLPLAPANAQQPNQAEQEGLTAPEVIESLDTNPSDQGALTPEVIDREDQPALYALLSRLRQAPPSLDGEPIPRPNAFASEPAKEMVPAQPENMYLFPENYIE